VPQRVGKLMERNSRTAGLFQVEVDSDAQGRTSARTATCCAATRRTGRAKNSGAHTFKLMEAEAALLLHKSGIVMPAIWRQKEKRVQVHILVCFLAYVV
jgi:hypothetical protein